MENAGAIAIFQVAFAIEAASVAGDDEFNVLLAGLGEIDAFEVAGGPIGFVIRIVVFAVIDEREGDFARLVAGGNGPQPSGTTYCGVRWNTTS